MANNTIKLKDRSLIVEEMVAAGTITPGMILQLDTVGKVKAHDGAGQNVLPYIAVEDELQGKGIDENYSAADPVQVWIPCRGCEADLLLTTSQTIVKGDLLESAGNGMVRKHTPNASDIYGNVDVTVYGRQIVGQAIEAVTTTGTAARIQVRIF